MQPEVLVRTARAIKLEAVRQGCTLAEIIDRLAEALPQE